MSYIIEGKTGKWELVIGLEVHCQVKTKSKLFSRSSTEFGKEQNSNVSFYDAAFPGQLPVINEYAIKQSVKTGLGLNATINLKSIFDRKSYFYADLPSGYQITQMFYPIVENGYLDVEFEEGNAEKRRIRINRLHMEQDAGKLLHDQDPQFSLVDLNRAGIALMEIVSEPDLKTPFEAMSYLRQLRSLIRALDTCDGNMDEGSMRCDANVSVMPLGCKTLGTRCEVKNLNSIRNVGDAIIYEANRQVEMIENGEEVSQETRLWNALTCVTKTMRSKEDAIDYRYFPDPDLAPIILTEEYIENVRKEMPELPEEKKARYIKELELSEYDAGVLTTSTEISSYFEKLILVHNPRIAINWLTSELFGRLNKLTIDLADSPVSAEMLIELLDLIEDNTISGKIAKDVLDIMIEEKKSAKIIVEEKGLKQNTNTDEIELMVEKIILDNPKQVEDYRAGNERLFGFFVGQAMKASGGKVNPKLVNDILKAKLDK